MSIMATPKTCFRKYKNTGTPVTNKSPKEQTPTNWLHTGVRIEELVERPSANRPNNKIPNNEQDFFAESQQGASKFSFDVI